MTADDLIRYLSWAIYVLIFVVATIRAVRRPLRANVDIALLFAVPALIVALEVPGEFGFMSLEDPLVGAIAACLIVAMVYLLLRLVDDFSDVPVWLMRSAEVALGLLIISMLGFALSPPEPRWLTVLFLTYLIGFLIYEVAALVAESQRSTGVTRRRMRAAAIGSLCLCATIVIASMTLWFPGWEGIWSPLTNVAGLASGISYFLGFAPPGLLRRAWQEPELRAFLGRAASLPRLPDTGSIIAEMERGPPPPWAPPTPASAFGTSRPRYCDSRRTAARSNTLRATVASPAGLSSPSERTSRSTYTGIAHLLPDRAEHPASRPCWLPPSRRGRSDWACWWCTRPTLRSSPMQTWTWCNCWPTRRPLSWRAVP